MQLRENLMVVFSLVLTNIFLLFVASVLGIGLFFIFGWFLIPIGLVITFVFAKIIISRIKLKGDSSKKVSFIEILFLYLTGLGVSFGLFTSISIFSDVISQRSKNIQQNKISSKFDSLKSGITFGNPKFYTEENKEVTQFKSYNFTISLPAQINTKTDTYSLNNLFVLKFSNGKVSLPKLVGCTVGLGTRYPIYVDTQQTVLPGDYSLNFVYEYYGTGTSCFQENVNTLKGTDFSIYDNQGVLIKNFKIDVIEQKSY